MPLLDPLTEFKASQAQHARGMATHLSSIAVLANLQTAETLSLSDEQLAAWLNSMSEEELNAQLTAHAQLAQQLDAVAGVIEWALPKTKIIRVDARPFMEKLAAQHRSAVPTENGWVVTTEPVPDAPRPPEEEQPTG